MKKEKQCTYYVSGMHCPACEVLIEKKISKFPGVTHVDASLSKNELQVSYQKGSRKSLDEINNALFESGYSVSDEPVGNVVFDQLTIMRAAAVFAFFFIGYLILEDSNILAQASVDGNSGIIAFFVLGIVAGVSSCAALVGGILLSVSKQWSSLYAGAKEHKRAFPFILFNAGRLVGFAVFGAALGYVGSFFQLSIQLASAMTLVVSVLMITIGLQMLQVPGFRNLTFRLPSFITRSISDESKFNGIWGPFMLGSFTFFLPCGFTLMAQTLALATGSPLTSMLMMGAFALGTLPMLGVISFSSISLQNNKALAGTFNLVVAIFIVLFGLYTVNSQLNVLGLVSASDIRAGFTSKQIEVSTTLGAKVVERNGKQVQQVTMQAKGFEYFPQTLQLKAGIPTELTVLNEGIVGCARAMFSAGLFNDVLYLQGDSSTTTFTPQKGSYKISCSMGMVTPVRVEVI
ncbi:MAG: sulfite exporter TauE/SafE family protein [bacterium]|nr:sulfite exporter TauE/SafE family protein [bacterium]